MEIDEFRNYCLSKPQTTEDFPFDEDVLVFKVAGKILALIQKIHSTVFIFFATKNKCE